MFGPDAAQQARAARQPGGPQGPLEPEFQFEIRPINDHIDPSLEQRRPPPSGDNPIPIVNMHSSPLTPLDSVTVKALTGRDKSPKVGGRRVDLPRKRKREHRSGSEDETGNVAKGAAKRGRKAGSANYKEKEVERLLRILRSEKPVGAKGWTKVAKIYNEWSGRKGHPTRDETSLKNKYQSLIKAKKPTGNVTRPKMVTEALKVESLINEHAGARDVDDDVDDSGSGSDSSGDDHSSSSDNESSGNDEPRVTAVARRAPSPVLPKRERAQRVGAPEMVKTFAYAMGPEAAEAREAARDRRSRDTMQLFGYTQQIDRLQSENAALRTQLSDTQRALDRAEFRLEMLNSRRSPSPPPRRRKHKPHNRDNYRGLQRVGGHIRVEKRYKDGGRSLEWVKEVDVSSDATDFDYRSDVPEEVRVPLHRSPSPFERLPALPIEGSSSLTRAEKDSLPVLGGKAELVITPRRAGGVPMKFVVTPVEK